MALGEAQLVSSLYTPQQLGSIAQKLNDTNRLSAKNARKHTKTRENMRKTREKHAKSPGNQAKNTQSARQKLGKPPKNTRFLPLLQESHLNIQGDSYLNMFIRLDLVLWIISYCTMSFFCGSLLALLKEQDFSQK